MGKFKRICALALTLVLFCTMLASCSGQSTKSEETTPQSESSKSTDKGEAENLVMVFWTDSEVPQDLEMVNEAVNKILLEKLNCTVTMKCINSGSYDNQITLMMAGQEQADLVLIGGRNMANMVGSGQLMAMEEYLDAYGSDIKNVMGDYVNTGKLQGHIYGIASYNIYGGGSGFLIRKSYVDKYNIDTEKFYSLDDFNELFARIHEDEPEQVLVAPVANGISILYGFCTYAMLDRLSDGIGSIVEGKGTEVTNWYATDTYREYVEIVNEWYKNGYIMKDIATNQESGPTLLKAGKGIGYFTMSSATVEETGTLQVGEQMVMLETTEPICTTTNCIGNTWVIPYHSQYPEKAMQVLNLMYVDADLINTLTYGVEGVHYIKNDNGRLSYPEGITAENSGYIISTTGAFGNQLIKSDWDTVTDEMIARRQKIKDTMTLSPAFGFLFDSSQLTEEKAAIDAVLSEYQSNIENGIMDMDTLDEFNDKLIANGIEAYIGEKQRQLDEWQKENK